MNCTAVEYQETVISGFTREGVTLNYRVTKGALAMHIPAQLQRTVHRDLEKQMFQRCVVSSRFKKP